MSSLLLKLITAISTMVCRIQTFPMRGVHVGRRVRFAGFAHIEARRGGEITIGDRVLLNSQDRRYHLGMWGKVKICADKPGAVVTIGANTRIHGSCIHAFRLIQIGERCLIAANCQIIDASGHELSFDDVSQRINSVDVGRAIIIEDDVWIGAGSLILPGVRIGRGSVIGACSVVTGDVPPMCVAAGNPARIVKDFGAPAIRSEPHSSLPRC